MVFEAAQDFTTIYMKFEEEFGDQEYVLEMPTHLNNLSPSKK